MRVVTQNVWGRRGAWSLRREVLKRGLADLRPDIVSFQEVVNTPDYDMVRDLMGPGYEVVYQERPEADGQAAAIASRWPLVGTAELEQRVTERVDSAATTLVAEVAAPEPIGPVMVVNHVPSWQLDFAVERELQSRAAAELVEKLIDGRRIHVILAGDITDPPESSSVRFWTGRQALGGVSVSYRDAWESVHPGEEGATYARENPILADPDWPFRRLDYILIRCGLHGGPTLGIARCERLFCEPVGGVWASDHFGVMADLELPHRPAPPLPNLAAEA
jgi:endonuclease/exonuclease/phosphatase family metal-dependent hydrolase